MILKKLISKCDFIIGANNVQSLPTDTDIPEVVIAGRSNVGKSTLINLITKNKKLSRVSSKPGCTRQINFYLINDGYMRLVDLPGYGYSQANKQEIANYMSLMEYYLSNRTSLIKVMLLIDALVNLKEIDLSFIEWLNYKRRFYQIVLTKVDKISENNLQIVKEGIKEKLKKFHFFLQPILAISSKKKMGTEELIYEITQYDQQY